MTAEELRLEGLRCLRRAQSKIEEATILTQFALFMADSFNSGVEAIDHAGIYIPRDEMLQIGFYKLNDARKLFQQAERLRKKGDRYVKSYKRHNKS